MSIFFPYTFSILMDFSSGPIPYFIFSIQFLFHVIVHDCLFIPQESAIYFFTDKFGQDRSHFRNTVLFQWYTFIFPEVFMFAVHGWGLFNSIGIRVVTAFNLHISDVNVYHDRSIYTLLYRWPHSILSRKEYFAENDNGVKCRLILRTEILSTLLLSDFAILTLDAHASTPPPLRMI